MLCHHTFTFGSTCAGLTHLELSGLVSGEAPTLHQLLEIFRASRCLEEIRLEYIVPTAATGLHPQTNTTSTLASTPAQTAPPTHTNTTPFPPHPPHHSKPPQLQGHAILTHLSLSPTARTVLECWSLDSSDSGSGSTSTPGPEFGPLGLSSGPWTVFFPTPLRGLYPDVLGVERVEIGELGVRVFCSSSSTRISSFSDDQPASASALTHGSPDSNLIPDASASASTSKSTSTSLQTPLISIQTHHRLSTQSTPTLIHTILPMFLFLHGHGHDYDAHHYYINADADANAGRDTDGDGDGGVELGILANLHLGPMIYVDDGVPHARALREELCEYFGSRVAMA
ncbi:hypothetical protein H0H92_012702 [Tricholoma furcatifolium]|nr:hypothetical protein H0H92_012702 [Tricholoma furcatifolium]